MFEIFFVVGFFIMLLMTGLSLLGVLAALLAATVFMLLGGLFVMALKVLPWLLLAVAAVWIWRCYQQKQRQRYYR
ncbi:phage shock protein G [Lonsdalea britannica]|uniref:Envelope stress response protein PspG n=1 Tax=Lonsdalea britannica TaxID=1082704 RepID=A0AAD0SET1_9GAMM|nr:envelope stress response protein PspG [Lonsdalea britannica]AXW85901.1 envelope stress response protein PspG [Lonsdalea britannica]OSM96204.1 phage shock protein G [Lonsdalea britannica]